ncbi:hypothetical protein Pmani_009785, partial [Petrolisthes manimaculis]
VSEDWLNHTGDSDLSDTGIQGQFEQASFQASKKFGDFEGGLNTSHRTFGDISNCVEKVVPESCISGGKKRLNDGFSSTSYISPSLPLTWLTPRSSPINDLSNLRRTKDIADVINHVPVTNQLDTEAVTTFRLAWKTPYGLTDQALDTTNSRR